MKRFQKYLLYFERTNPGPPGNSDRIILTGELRATLDGQIRSCYLSSSKKGKFKHVSNH
jgi:hypothetical protein